MCAIQKHDSLHYHRSARFKGDEKSQSKGTNFSTKLIGGEMYYKHVWEVFSTWFSPLDNR